MSDAGYFDVSIAHAVPGRIRLRFSELIASPELGEKLEDRLADLPGLQACEVRASSGSLVVHYDAHQERVVLDRLNDLFPALRMAGSHERAKSSTAGGAEGSHDSRQGTAGGHNGRFAPPDFWSGTSLETDGLGETIAAFFTVLNRRLERLTGSVDLRVAVPVMLALLGASSLLLSLLRRQRLPLPRWFDFFWFAFCTFLALNASAVESAWSKEQEQTQKEKQENERAEPAGEVAPE